MSPYSLPAFLVGLLWLVIVVVNLLLFPVLPQPPAVGTIALCLFGTLFLVGPSLLQDRNLQPPPAPLFMTYREWLKPVFNWIVFLMLPAMVAGTAIDLSLGGGFDASVGFAERRLAHVTQGVEFSPLRYVSLLCKSSGLLALAYIFATRAPLAIIGIAFGVTMLSGVIETLTYGGRAFLRVSFSIIAAATIIGNAGWIMRHRAKVAFVGFWVFLVMMIANIVFNRLRVYNDVEFMLIVRTGNVVLNALGIPGASPDIAYAVGTVAGYLITPLGYFDHFVNVHALPPTFGGFTFQTIGARLGVDFQDIKDYVDGYYVDFGIEYNIWATAYRELVIDTGLYLFLPTCLAAGWISRILRRHSATNPGALALNVVFYAWLLNSPFESIMKSRYVEFAAVLAGVICAGMMVIRVKAGVRTGPAAPAAMEDEQPDGEIGDSSAPHTA